MPFQWRLLCDTLWPEPRSQTKLLQMIQPELYKNTHLLLSYKNPAVKDSIRNNKFHFHKQSAKQLASVCDHFFRRYPTATIIPVPSSTNRERQRGYQHLLNILQYCEHRNQVRIDILKKQTNTPQQSHVSKKIRLRQQVGSFGCNTERIHTLAPTVILFDDVVTTESTIAAARAALTPHLQPGTKLICFAIAH